MTPVLSALFAGARMPHPPAPAPGPPPPPPPPSTDPYFASVVLLLHPDNPIVDKSSYARPLTNLGITLVTETFLGNTLLMNNAADTVSQLTTDPSASLAKAAALPYTIEFSMRVNSLTGSRTYLFMGWDATRYHALTANAAGTSFQLVGVDGTSVTYATGLAPGAWHQYALSYDGSNLRTFIDGSLVNLIPGLTTTALTGTPKFGTFAIPDRSDLRRPIADITEVRVTLGVARYTADYSPATTQFPNS